MSIATIVPHAADYDVATLRKANFGSFLVVGRGVASTPYWTARCAEYGPPQTVEGFLSLGYTKDNLTAAARVMLDEAQLIVERCRVREFPIEDWAILPQRADAPWVTTYICDVGLDKSIVKHLVTKGDSVVRLSNRWERKGYTHEWSFRLAIVRDGVVRVVLMPVVDQQGWIMKRVRGSRVWPSWQSVVR